MCFFHSSLPTIIHNHTNSLSKAVMLSCMAWGLYTPAYALLSYWREWGRPLLLARTCPRCENGASVLLCAVCSLFDCLKNAHIARGIMCHRLDVCTSTDMQSEALLCTLPPSNIDCSFQCPDTSACLFALHAVSSSHFPPSHTHTHTVWVVTPPNSCCCSMAHTTARPAAVVHTQGRCVQVMLWWR